MQTRRVYMNVEVAVAEVCVFGCFWYFFGTTVFLFALGCLMVPLSRLPAFCATAQHACNSLARELPLRLIGFIFAGFLYVPFCPCFGLWSIGSWFYFVCSRATWPLGWLVGWCSAWLVGL